MTKEEQKRDKYYRKTYGVGLDWYEARRKEQNFACGICKRPETDFTRRLAIDHDHGYKKVKIRAAKCAEGWAIRARYLGHEYCDFGHPRIEMTRRMRETFKILSCRGLLCPHCNRGLRYYQDCPIRLAGASTYLRKHQGEK